MKKHWRILPPALLALALTVLPSAALAAGPYQLPAQFYGLITVTGPESSMPALPGSLVTSRVNGAETTFDPLPVGLAGRYGGSTGPEDKLIVQGPTLVPGDTISFYLNGVAATGTAPFSSGSTQRLDLTVPDNQGPTSPGNLSRATPEGVNQPAFTWEKSRDSLSGVAGYAVRLDEGAWQWLGNVLTWTAGELIADGAHRVEVYARDGVGNASAAASLPFNIDTRLPAAYNISAASVQQTVAIITFSSNKEALSWLDYGLKAGEYPWQDIPVSTSPNTSHAITLSGLVPNTTYHYRVRLQDNQGNKAASEDQSFTTLASPEPGTTPLATATVTPTPAPGGAATPTPNPTARPVMDDRGVMLQTVVVTSADTLARVELSEGTRALDRAGKPLSQVALQPLVEAPQFFDGALLVSYSLLPEEAAFSPSVKLTVSYDPAALPAGYSESQLKLARYDAGAREWVLLPSTVDNAGGTVSALSSKFGYISLVATQEEHDSGTPAAPVQGSGGIDGLIEKAMMIGAGLIAFLALLIAAVIVLLKRRPRKA